MTIIKFSWIMLAILFVGYGLAIFFIPDELRSLGFINLGALVILIVASFLIKGDGTTQNHPKHDVHSGHDVGLTREEFTDVGRDSDSSESGDSDSGGVD